MTAGVDATHSDEFDLVAAWTAELAAGRDAQTMLAAACRGSGSPAALAWLGEALHLDADTTLLDVGSGLGGPLQWAVERHGVRPLAAEPMPRAAQGAARLFDHPVVVAPGDALPVSSASVDAAWMLGVLDTVEEPGRCLVEARRVLRPHGRLGLLAYVADGPVDPEDAPDGNTFQTADDLRGALADAGFVVVERIVSDQLPPPPMDWRVRQEAIDRELEERHAADPRWARARDQEHRFGRLLSSGAVHPELVHAMCI
ncbi:class I SAM-dependent methyltransferase [Dermatobacter hominis]|uniref:class I SAM-dependent methyltransferase n=1 Tax=Dermatobacter hominis TaxID=2884263 RepID=UPI001D12F1B8|nr:class I SAM-dependent methyltransferase [Dermatobacter hominis]UDY34988.1 methyltransferase domain-containing protein [Dermatobacter hominis]